jgi:hypothetical protein
LYSQVAHDDGKIPLASFSNGCEREMAKFLD